MPVQIDQYKVKLHFRQLFADPRLFQEDSNLPRLFLQEKKGLELSTAQLIVQLDPFRMVDQYGQSPGIVGTMNYNFQGKKKTRSEYMENVTIHLEYFDFGTGITPESHETAWASGSLWTMPFNLKSFEHNPVNLEIPDVKSLYSMVKERAQPTTIASVELDNLSKDKFDIAQRYLEITLGRMAETDNMTLEVYASRYLDPPERMALDRRLTRESTDSTVYVILGRR